MTRGSMIVAFTLVAGLVIGAGRAPLLPRAGDRIPDGSAYPGASPDTGRAMYTTRADAPGTYTFDEAKAYCAGLDASAHDDWRVPTKGELNVLFRNRTAIGGFNLTGLFPAGWYLSSGELNYHAWNQRFSDGHQNWHSMSLDASLRCVR